MPKGRKRPAKPLPEPVRQAYTAFLAERAYRGGTVQAYLKVATQIIDSGETPAAWLSSYVADAKKNKGGVAKGTAEQYLAGARRFREWLVSIGHPKAGPKPEVVLRAVVRKKQDLTDLVGKALTDDELDLYLKALKADKRITPEPLCILRLMPLTGLRISEACGLRQSDIGVRMGTSVGLLVGEHSAKGGKIRWVPLTPNAQKLLREYQQTYAPRGEWLFPSPRAPKKPIGASAVRRHHDRIVAGLPFPPFVPHDLRHTYSTKLRESGVELDVIRDILGHSDIATTEHYTHGRASYLAKEVRKVLG